MSGFPSHLERKRLCSMVGAMVFVNDAATRPACGLEHDEQIQTGKHPLRFNSTPHLPHEWDAGVLFEETMKLCSDLLGLAGDVCPLTDSDMVGRFAATTKRFRWTHGELHALHTAHGSSPESTGLLKAPGVRNDAWLNIHRRRRKGTAGHGRGYEGFAQLRGMSQHRELGRWMPQQRGQCVSNG